MSYDHKVAEVNTTTADPLLLPATVFPGEGNKAGYIPMVTTMDTTMVTTRSAGKQTRLCPTDHNKSINITDEALQCKQTKAVTSDLVITIECDNNCWLRQEPHESLSLSVCPLQGCFLLTFLAQIFEQPVNNSQSAASQQSVNSQSGNHHTVGTLNTFSCCDKFDLMVDFVHRIENELLRVA